MSADSTTPLRNKSKRLNVPFVSPLANKSKKLSQYQNYPSKKVETSIEIEAENSRTTTSNEVEDNSENLDQEIKSVMDKILKCRSENSSNPVINVDEDFKRWQKVIHQYNEIRDDCLLVFGRLAELRGIPVRDLYQEFNLELDD